jgi:ABC-type transport system involved in multi-copper enzyme maturation permease subunit
MLRTILRKELLENIHSYRFPLFALICVVLIPLGMSVNNAQYAKRLKDYNEQVRLADEAQSGLKIQDLMAGRVTIKGFRPPSQLSVFSQGLESALPAYYQFAQDGFSQGESSSSDATLTSTQGKFDFVFLIQMVISLVGLLFASDMISGEKESGTLRAMLSNSLPRDAILVGKIAGGYLALLAPFLVALLLGVMLLLPGGFPLFAGDIPARIAVMAGAAALFILIYYVIGTMVSATSAKARTSLVAILLIWTGFQLVIPKLSDIAAALINPVRTDTQVSLEKSLLINTLETESAKSLGREYDKIFTGKAGQDAANDQNSPEMKKWAPIRDEMQLKTRESKAAQLAAIDETFLAQQRRQRKLAAALSLISPSSAFGHLAADLCGTGDLARAKYIEAVRSHQNALETELFSKVKRTLMMHEGGRTTMMFSAQPVDPKKLPKFAVAQASLGEALKANAASIAALLFWLIAPFAFAYVRFLKYDVR